MFSFCSKSLISFIFAIFLSFNLTLVAKARVIDHSYIESLVINQVGNELKHKGFKDFDVKVLNIPVQDIKVADNKRVDIKILPSKNGLNSQEFRTVKVYVNSNIYKVFGVSVKIKAYKDVLVAKDIIPRYRAVSIGNSYLKKVDVSSLNGNVLDYKALKNDLITKKMFKKDEIIDKRFVKYRPDIAKDDQVIVEFITKSGLYLTVSGISLSEGNIGDIISVKNDTYKKIYTGRVISKNRVSIDI